jgi:hypothetical protein
MITLFRDAALEEIAKITVNFRNVAIAGGYAACPDKAGDIDVWLLDQDIKGSTWNLQHSIALQIDRTVNAFRRFPDDVPEHVQKDYQDTTFALLRAYHSKVSGKTVQILAAPEKTLQELVNRFDVSTHAIGYMLADPFTLVKGKNWTPIDQQPRACHLNTPDSTRERLVKLCARYGFQLDKADEFLLDLST